jgi:hypothetical protein
MEKDFGIKLMMKWISFPENPLPESTLTFTEKKAINGMRTIGIDVLEKTDQTSPWMRNGRSW